jgi:RNA polymerase sigma-70 factor (ECF subfamily)
MSSEELEHIYFQYNKRVYNTVLSYVQNIEDAEEITQDVFLEVYRSSENFKGESSLSTWIYRIAINKCLDFIKYKNRKKRFAF